jgi:hypothetical protein
MAAAAASAAKGRTAKKRVIMFAWGGRKWKRGGKVQGSERSNAIGMCRVGVFERRLMRSEAERGALPATIKLLGAACAARCVLPYWNTLPCHIVCFKSAQSAQPTAALDTKRIALTALRLTLCALACTACGWVAFFGLPEMCMNATITVLSTGTYAVTTGASSEACECIFTISGFHIIEASVEIYSTPPRDISGRKLLAYTLRWHLGQDVHALSRYSTLITWRFSRS